MPGERDLIAEIRARVPAAPPWLLVGIGDDAAVVKPERGALEILTTDGLIEGIHFDRRFSTARDIGWKALAVNLSDVAAMGGTPRLALLSLSLPADSAAGEVHALVDGFLALAADARVTLAGGNISRSPGPLMVDVTVTGFARAPRAHARGRTRAGYDLYVTGASARRRRPRLAEGIGRRGGARRRRRHGRVRPAPLRPSRACASARCSAAIAPPARVWT